MQTPNPTTSTPAPLADQPRSSVVSLRTAVIVFAIVEAIGLGWIVFRTL